MGSSASPVMAHIYMEYFEELSLDPEFPKPSPWRKRYVDDVISIVKKNKVDTFFNHLNVVDPNVKFTMVSPGTDGSIPFLDTRFSPTKIIPSNSTICRKPALINWYLDWNSNHLISAKISRLCLIL